MNTLNQSVFLRSLQKKPIERTPVWIMRQAGRYLPEYRKVREQAGDFLTLCKTPELACEVTLQPLRRFPLDAAILFSDILTIPDALGLGLHFIEGEGPCFSNPIKTVGQVDSLAIEVIEEKLDYVNQAVRLIRREMPADLPLIGFSGSPWTLACYMLEGGSSKEFKQVLKFLYTESSAMERLLAKLTSAIIDYLSMQIRGGVNTVMLFDTWGGILSTPNYLNFSLKYLSTIVQEIKKKYPAIPIILFTKGGGQWLQSIAKSGCDAIGVDWTCDLKRARGEVGHMVALQGNLDPAVLLTNRECIRQQVKNVLEAYGEGTGHIFNLGHGITPDVPPENVSFMVEAVREFSEGARFS
ncbi:uroporphyrinogen decarboxylase (plasmid) [Legionella adelaidensis]|uniref:Uroporphyrinogen decarboxylase n=1 Tax=Legionella adelaidensis TaxID=45056 RepID=A0A0W0R535_9GAMM|nr:uroporphyrinogen decarboxylase [Legionella adelaidensis]KTC66124.1 uroporphyrinogen decarboxylase [Legionella adelaidensis]VEH85806.1 uroporphyrinogen decarboxylase [Legionella adelaidensis]